MRAALAGGSEKSVRCIIAVRPKRATAGVNQPPRYRVTFHHHTKDEPMSVPVTQEELRQLRTAVTQLTFLTQAMYQEMVKRDLVPVPEFSRYAGDLRLAVLDEDLRKVWEKAREANEQHIRDAAKRQHPD